jgi:hypothetical protein
MKAVLSWRREKGRCARASAMPDSARCCRMCHTRQLALNMNATKTAIWKRLEERWDQGFGTLLPEEQEAIALWWLEAETMNGSLNQFFWNSSGDLALIAVAGLKNLDAPTTLRAFESALKYFGNHYPTSREARMQVLEAIEREHGSDVFTPASNVIQDLPERFVEAAVERLTSIYVRIDMDHSEGSAAKS